MLSRESRGAPCAAAIPEYPGPPNCGQCYLAALLERSGWRTCSRRGGLDTLRTRPPQAESERCPPRIPVAQVNGGETTNLSSSPSRVLAREGSVQDAAPAPNGPPAHTHDTGGLALFRAEDAFVVPADQLGIADRRRHALSFLLDVGEGSNN